MLISPKQVRKSRVDLVSHSSWCANAVLAYRLDAMADRKAEVILQWTFEGERMSCDLRRSVSWMSLAKSDLRILEHLMHTPPEVTLTLSGRLHSASWI
jgi:hypothetical protein